MQERGLQIIALEEALLHQTNQDNEAATYYLFEKWLKGVEKTLEEQNHVLLLALDEFETLEDEKTTKFLSLPLLLDWLRSVTQNYSHVALLFSGVHNINDLITKTGMNWGSYFVHVQTLKVSFLQPTEAHKLIVQPVPDFPGEQVFSEEVVEAIIKETGCHPFLVQAVCQALIRRLNADNSPRYRAELRDIAPAVDKVFDTFDYFDDLWRRTDQHQQACLEALQEIGEGDLHAITQKCGLDEEIVHHALQILNKKRDMVLEEDGIYRISVPIFRTWIGRQIPDLQN